MTFGSAGASCGRPYDPEAAASRLEAEIAAYRDRTAAPSRRIEHRMRELNVPGASVAVIRDHAIDWARAFGVADAATGEPITPRTRFQAASISKSVAAVLALMLVEDGRLELDAPINESLAGWRIPSNPLTAETPVTLRHLLSHTAGLTVHGFPGYEPGEALPELGEILDGVPPANTDPVRVVVEPGTIWLYSGGGYTVVQLAITEAGGRGFADLAAERILEPLGMDDSSFDQPLPLAASAAAATGHTHGGRPLARKHHVYPELAAAGLWTTPTDLAKLLIELQLALEGRSERLLSQRTASLMLTEARDNYGLGFIVRDDDGPPSFGHTGGNAGFAASMLVSRNRGHGVVVMTNGDRGGRLFNEIARAVRRVYDW